MVLKGDCNLRFFLGSDRYSEDIDFDIETISKETLRKRIDKVLSGQALQASLAAAQIRLVSHSAPKQTETVQRWKVQLRVQGLDVPSKIEFSRRGIDHNGAIFEPIGPQVLAEHRLTQTFMAHYGPAYATKQKVEALAGRSETQARDIYDLGHLFARYNQPTDSMAPLLVAKAIECAMSVDFDQFRGQVVEYLEGDSRVFYAERSAWDKLQAQVIAALEKLA